MAIDGTTMPHRPLGRAPRPHGRGWSPAHQMPKPLDFPSSRVTTSALTQLPACKHCHLASDSLARSTMPVLLNSVQRGGCEKRAVGGRECAPGWRRRVGPSTQCPRGGFQNTPLRLPHLLHIHPLHPRRAPVQEPKLHEHACTREGCQHSPSNAGRYSSRMRGGVRSLFDS